MLTATATSKQLRPNLVMTGLVAPDCGLAAVISVGDECRDRMPLPARTATRCEPSRAVKLPRVGGDSPGKARALDVACVATPPNQ